MDLNNIERNQLDYILTDVLPVELSELFSYHYFYEYLGNNQSNINSILKKIIKQKNDNQELFKDSKSWASMPLSYTIMKQLNTERMISVLNPLGALQLFLFISAYQKEILTLLQKNNVFSLRYHQKNNDLYYKNKNKSVIKYFVDLTDETGKEIIEQTGMYFNIGPYKSIAAFTSSEEWMVLNSKYKYCIRADYKACFDSIYTHTFNWLIGKDVNDTKNFKNSSIYNTIDQVLMNINARTSNGIVVGPEFSRMVAEMLLQSIDRDVFCILLNKSIFMDEDYNVYRFVDDIFIFADSEQLVDTIVELYSCVSRKYLLSLNAEKISKHKVPFVLDPWINDTNLFTNRLIFLLFYSKIEQKEHISGCKMEYNGEIVNSHMFKLESFLISRTTIMKQFNGLICKYPSKGKTIVAYFLSTLLNKIGIHKENVKIFADNISDKAVFYFLDLVLFGYSYFPNYNNTQKLLSIISYVNDEVNIIAKKEMLQLLFDKYAYIFNKANLNDIVNLILFYYSAKIEIPYRQEINIVNKLIAKDDPILWASYLLYSQYSKKYYNEIRTRIGTLLIERMDAIVHTHNIYTYREFWWILIFNKSPHLKVIEQEKIDDIISRISTNEDGNVGNILEKLFLDFLKNSTNQFFEWDINKRNFLRNVTFKTKQRSIFKNYRERILALYWSSV